MVDTSVRYGEAEQCFLKGVQGKYIKSLNIGLKCYYLKRKLCEYIDVQGYAKWDNLHKQR